MTDERKQCVGMVHRTQKTIMGRGTPTRQKAGVAAQCLSQALPGENLCATHLAQHERMRQKSEYRKNQAAYRQSLKDRNQ